MFRREKVLVQMSAILENSFPISLPPGCKAGRPDSPTWLHQRAGHIIYLDVAGVHRGG